jgi:uncharacterized protein (UPF0147 family)
VWAEAPLYSHTPIPHYLFMDVASELTLAREALLVGQAGKARVCARRAAGWAIRAWYRRQDDDQSWDGDAMKQLGRLRDDARVPASVRQAAERLTTKVDKNHELPFVADPVEDAQHILAFVTAD